MILEPGSAPLSALAAVYRGTGAVRLPPTLRPQVEDSAAAVARAAAGDAAVYGVNTGFGKLAHIRIPLEDTATLQRNLVLSHCCGVGPALDPADVRLMMALKLLSLGRGASGVRWEVVTLLEGMLAAGIVPEIPQQGSVGASGDLAPLAHLAAVMIGEGWVLSAGRRSAGRDALREAGLQPVVLGPKEGLALLNGTQFSTAAALSGLFAAFRGAEA
ncbi:MAG: aromatic amino acid lyase, partial [Pseudomonadota bacterium]